MKPLSADDSVGIPHVKVGHCQGFDLNKKPHKLYAYGVFYVCFLKFEWRFFMELELIEFIFKPLADLAFFPITILLAIWGYIRQQRLQKEEHDFRTKERQQEHRFKEYQGLFKNLSETLDSKALNSNLKNDIVNMYTRILLVKDDKNKNGKPNKIEELLLTKLANIEIQEDKNNTEQLQYEFINAILEDLNKLGISEEAQLQFFPNVKSQPNSPKTKETKPSFRTQIKKILSFFRTQIKKILSFFINNKSATASIDNPSTVPENFENSQYVWINTAKRYFPNAFENMLKDGLACTYGEDYYGNLLTRIKHGDTIFLYHSGTGIIAQGTVNESDNKEGGKGVSRLVKPPTTIMDEDPNENQYNVKVDWEVKWNSSKKSTAVSPAEIKADCKHYLFIPTVQYLNRDVGEKIVAKLIKNQKNS